MPDDDKMLIVPLGEESKIITQTIANDTARKILELLAESAMSTSGIAKKLDIPLTTAQYNIEKLMEAGLVVVEKTKYSEKGREVKLYAPAKRMIVLVPRGNSSQSLIDALKKYLVLLPVAAAASLLVEVVMQLRNTASVVTDLATGGVPMMSKSAGEANDSVRALTFTNNYGNGLGTQSSAPLPDVAPALENATSQLATGSVSGRIATGNTTAGMPNGYEAIANASAPQADGSSVAMMAPAPTGTTAGADQALWAQHTQSVPPTGASQSLLPADLLNHWGLWFFIGCLLIISILVVYEVYTRRKAGKK